MTGAILSIWQACRVRRWHTNAELAGTDDRIDGHSGRVARIILKLHPCPSRDLLIAALIHDDGEYGIGDIAQPAKVMLRQFEPAAMARLNACEEDALAEVWQAPIDYLTTTETQWLRFADRLDAYVWAAKHGARMDRNGWPEDWQALLAMARDLNSQAATDALQDLISDLA